MPPRPAPGLSTFIAAWPRAIENNEITIELPWAITLSDAEDSPPFGTRVSIENNAITIGCPEIPPLDCTLLDRFMVGGAAGA